MKSIEFPSCFNGEFATVYATGFIHLENFYSKLETIVQILYTHTHKYRHSLVVTIALRKKSSRKNTRQTRIKKRHSI